MTTYMFGKKSNLIVRKFVVILQAPVVKDQDKGV